MLKFFCNHLFGVKTSRFGHKYYMYAKICKPLVVLSILMHFLISIPDTTSLSVI